MSDLRIVVVTGLSGSGKSTASKALEDSGYYCVDNIPGVLLPKLIDLFEQTTGEVEKLALTIDGRERGFLAGLDKTIGEIKERAPRLEILFLDSRDEALIRRFSETRRKHPFSPEGSVQEGIDAERRQLKAFRDLADMVLDTSEYTVHQLREFVTQRFGAPKGKDRLRVNLKSFGYRNGVPQDSDLVVDVRFLSNPFFQEGLRDMDGRTDEVKGFLRQDQGWTEFLERTSSLLHFLLPRYEREGKSYLTIAFGCTGGKHRSVAVVEEMAAGLRKAGWPVSVMHRDL
ncbi:MAG: RNase adapter RapZ [Nitrospirae bacterium]|nr:RNase adapter RapZ [Nitrospirota bacterium]